VQDVNAPFTERIRAIEAHAMNLEPALVQARFFVDFSAVETNM
jgi:hypothetical protein